MGEQYLSPLLATPTTVKPPFLQPNHGIKTNFLGVNKRWKEEILFPTMPAELVVGAPLDVIFDRLASRLVLDYFRHRKLDERVLNKLKVKFLSINAVVDDAEQKQIQNPPVRDWLFKVKDAVFDVEDLLNEIHYESLKCQMEAEPKTTSSKVWNFFNIFSVSSFDKEIESRIKLALDNLEILSKLKGDLGLKEVIVVGLESGSGSKVSKKLPSTSLMIESFIYGRDYDKEIIFNWLTSDADNCNQPSILSVVGMGGMGKTTLVQHRFLLVLDDVCNKKRNKWEAVQTPLNYGAQGSRILVTTRSGKVASTMQSKKVHYLEQLQEDHCWQVFRKHAFQDDNPELNAEQKEIGMKIVKKCQGLPLALKTIGCLLRTKSSVSKWESLSPPSCSSQEMLGVDDKAKCISERTRHFSFPMNHVQYFDGFGSLFDVKRLRTFMPISTEMDCFFGWNCEMWVQELFSKFKFLRVLSLSSCSGLTEVPDFVGNLKHLCSLDLSYTDIKKLPDSMCSLYNLQILKLKYCINLEELPSNLEKLTNLRCLEFIGTKVRKMPMHLGKLKNLQELSTFCVGKSSEFGIQQLGELNLRGSLSIEELQNIKNPSNALAANLKNKINLVELKVEWNWNQNPDDPKKEKEILENLQPSKHLKRLSIRNYGGTQFPSMLFDHSLSNVVSLTLENCKYCIYLPPLGGLPFLKSLIISRFNGIVSIDTNFYGNSTSSFTSLKILEFSDMQEWEEWECKAVTGAFPCLQHLSIRKCPKFRGHLPEKLLHLKYLFIFNCEQLVASTPMSPEIRTLNLQDCGEVKFDYRPTTTTLKELQVTGPSLEASSSELQVMGPSLEASSLEPQITGPSLEASSSELQVTGPSLEASPSEPQVTGPSLEASPLEPQVTGPSTEASPLELQLQVTRPSMEASSSELQVTGPSLEASSSELQVTGPSLEASTLKMNEHIISNTSLESLDICSCPNMNIVMTHSYDLLAIMKLNCSCDSLMIFPLDFFPKLHLLDLIQCRNLQMISQEKVHNHLETLIINKCPQFESFPSQGLSAPSLQGLTIEGLENLKSLPVSMDVLLPSLGRLVIKNCPKEVESFPGEGLPSNLTKMYLSNCYKLIASMKGALGTNTSLKYLDFENMDVESFPEEGLLPLSLQFLQIHNFPYLKTLDYKGLCQLSSLEELTLRDNPSLQCLPQEGLPKSISTLRISGNCPLLQQRRLGPKGEDWGKIVHIENIWVPILHNILTTFELHSFLHNSNTSFTLTLSTHLMIRGYLKKMMANCKILDFQDFQIGFDFGDDPLSNVESIKV
ncbi:putative disease resistance protein, partial [Mucuna pruriens]